MKSMLFKVSFAFMLACLLFFVFQDVTMAGITGKISGTVKDAETGEALPGVNVVLVGTIQGAATDVDGYYFIVNIPPGTYSVTASMMGYRSVRKTEVSVTADRTTPLDFDLKMTTIEGEEVTIVAEREIVPMDVSSSHISAEIEDIVEVPLVTDLGQYISLQAGVKGDLIRGGGLDQTQFMMDGLMVVDNKANKPMMMVNLSAVKELNVIKGGFNAEYGNVRSGLINVVTKEGSPSTYHSSIDFRISPAHLKHDGVSIFDPENYYLKPFLDPAVCWVGTKNGSWDEKTQSRYTEFRGWNAVSEALLSDQDQTNDRTPEECRDLFLWRHRAEGSDALMPNNYEELTGRESHEGEYGHKPDWNLDASFGGPVPLIGKYLGNLSFFISYRNNWEMFAIPTSREYYKEENAQLKLTSRLSPSMKLTFSGLYGEINTVARDSRGSDLDGYLTSGWDMFNTRTVTGEAYGDGEGIHTYWPSSNNPYDVYRSMLGISFDHVLSPRTFYNIRITHANSKNFCNGPNFFRDTTTVRCFGNTPIDEVPYGFKGIEGAEYMEDGMLAAGFASEARDWSEVNTYNVKFDLTSQVDKYNQVKFGLDFNYDNIDVQYAGIRMGWPVNSWEAAWDYSPYRLGAYVQDKLEFEGIIANFGLRLDYNEPNCDWYTVDRYSKYFQKEFKDVFTEITPAEPAEGHMKLSPRLGISHPISANAKLYFNYGHFYSMPTSTSMYKIDYGTPVTGIRAIGNPNAALPRTVAYELGVEYNVADLFLIHLSGYYKDVSDQTGNVQYTDYLGSVDYSITENNNYADIRGFEVRIDKRWGKWITGWLNYDYMVTTSGYIGRQHYYQDLREQALYGLQNPYQERPLARPIFRSNITFRTPDGWGPSVGKMKPLSNFNISPLITWEAGNYIEWDPLETYKLKQNLQWKGTYNIDLRISKLTQFGKYYMTLFLDINNVFNIKNLNTRGFANNQDWTNYLKSLHLPMYGGTEGASEENYKNEGMIKGNDKVGDVKSDDKQYIDMPNREFLTYLGLRSFFFGVKFNF